MKTSALLLALLALAAAGPATAQLDPLTDPFPHTLDDKSDKRLDRVEQTLREMRALLYQGRDTGKAVVVQPAETAGQIETLTNRVNDLEATLRRVNGQIDQISSDIAAMRREQTGSIAAQQAANGQNAAIAARLAAVEKQLAVLVNAQTAADKAQKEQEAKAAADPDAAFDAAMQLYASDQTRAAAAAFQTYLDNFGDRPEAAEARYYLGESYFKQADYADAATAYIAAIRGWPATNWAPDAVVKLSQALLELRKPADACGILKEFTTRYPRATAALKAQAASAKTRARCG